MYYSNLTNGKYFSIFYLKHTISHHCSSLYHVAWYTLMSFDFKSIVCHCFWLKIQSDIFDNSRKAKNGDVITMHYSGKLTNGKEFDSSYSRKQPFNFKLGAGQVIPGWEKGVPGMCIGEQRKLTVPPALGMLI